MGLGSILASAFHLMLPTSSPHRATGGVSLAVRLVGFLAIVFATTATRAETGLEATLTTTERRELQREGRLIVDLLQNLHYTDRQFHEIEGREIIDQFINDLDPEKLLLTQEEVTFLHRRFDRTFKTVYLLKGEFAPVFEIFELVRARVKDREPWIAAQLDAGLDFNAPESLAIESFPAPPSDATERDRRWRLRLKSAVLREMLAGRSQEAAYREVRQSYQKWARELEQLTAIEVRARFLERLINLFDPHSGYFSPREAHEFQIMMEGAVGGVGIDIESDNDGCFIDRLASGGPAETQRVLQVGDELLEVAESDQAWVPLKGSRYSEVIARLRGKPDTTLRLAYRRGRDGERREAEIKREEVLLVDQKAHGVITTVRSAGDHVRTVGCIELPDFYAAGEAGATSSASRDVAELIDQMKTKHVEAIVMDLRSNPGGALSEAVGLAGLFLPTGVVSITRSSDGKTSEQKIAENKPVWLGPLVVLTSNASASASEIFAGAMRFHRRGIIVGSDTTFGKGSVQIYMELDRSPAHNGAQLPWGTLRLTGQRFYFPSGISPQRVGAVSDIASDEQERDGFQREQDLPHALSAETIALSNVQPATGDFAVATAELIAALKEITAKRKAELPEFALRRRWIEIAKKSADRKEVSLVLEQRRTERDRSEKEVAGLRSEYRRYAAEHAYPHEAVEIAKVQAALERHQTNLRARCPVGKDAKEGWLDGGQFLFEAGGEVRELRFEATDFQNYAENAPNLAKVFSAGAEPPVSADAVMQSLRELKLAKHPDEQTVLRCFETTGEVRSAAEPALRARVEALLREITRVDPEIGQTRRLLDVSQREAERLAADWADRWSPPEAKQSAK